MLPWVTPCVAGVRRCLKPIAAQSPHATLWSSPGINGVTRRHYQRCGMTESQRSIRTYTRTRTKRGAQSDVTEGSPSDLRITLQQHYHYAIELCAKCPKALGPLHSLAHRTVKIASIFNVRFLATVPTGQQLTFLNCKIP